MSLGYEFIADDTPVQKLFDRIETAIGDVSLLQFLATDADEHIKRRAEQRFASEGDDVSGQWAPLSPYTIAERVHENTWPGKIQHRTGALENYIIQTQGRLGADAAGVTLEEPSITGDAVLRAKFDSAQLGNSRTGAPARPVLGLNEQDSEVLLTMLVAHVTEILAFGGSF